MEFITACFFNIQKNIETKIEGKIEKFNLVKPVFLSSQFIAKKLGQWRDYSFYNLFIVLLFCTFLAFTAEWSGINEVTN